MILELMQRTENVWNVTGEHDDETEIEYFYKKEQEH